MDKAEKRDGKWYCVNHDRKMETFTYGMVNREETMWVCKADGCGNHVHPPLEPDRTCRECGKLGFSDPCYKCLVS